VTDESIPKRVQSMLATWLSTYMSASETVTAAALSRGWQRGEQAERTGHLGAVDEWHHSEVGLKWGGRGSNPRPTD
jgi:hypothetical protein